MPFAPAQRLTSRGAKMMMEASIRKAEELGVAITVAIVDGGGHLLLLERKDGGRFHTIHSSITKAVCAASNKRPSAHPREPGPRSRHRPRPRTGRGAPGGGPRWKEDSRSSSRESAPGASE
jgi:hypothetical protein